jgi:glc operon protein GlcG
MALTQAEANRMIQAAIAKAEELHVKLSVAVCDVGGNLLAFNRTEGASAVSATVAQGKAAASAGFGRPSGALAADSPVIQSIIAPLGGRMLPAQGPYRLTRMANWEGLSAAVARRLNRMRRVPTLAGLRSQPIHMRCGDSTPGTCRDASLRAALRVPSLYGPL